MVEKVRAVSDGKRIASLEHELNQIKDDHIRNWTKSVLFVIPDDFWIKPPSSSGKYHPEDEFCEGGSIIHAKRVFYAAKVLCDSMGSGLTDVEIDEVLSAALLHDCLIGYGRMHPDVFRSYLFHHQSEAFVNKYPRIVNCVERHMGRWGMEKPVTTQEIIVHYADNMASKAHLLMASGTYNLIHPIERRDKNVAV